MKVKIFIICLTALLALSMLACSSKATDGTGEPAKKTTSYAAATTVEFYTCSDFEKNNNITEEITFTVNKGVTIMLCSNQATGFQWDEEAQISDTSIVQQTGHEYSAPVGDKVGAAGTEKFILTGVNPGTTTVYLEYSQPWEGGEKAVWTCTLTITVK